MAKSFERDIKLVVSIKKSPDYELPGIVSDIAKFRKSIESIQDLMDLSFSVSVKASSIKNVKDLSTALQSLSAAFSDSKATKAINNIKELQKYMGKFSSASVIEMKTAIDSLSASLSKLTVGRLAKSITTLIDVIEKQRSSIENTIKTLNDFSASLSGFIDKLVITKTSLDSLSPSIERAQKAFAGLKSASVGINIAGPTTGNLKEVGSLIGKYTELEHKIELASVSVLEFNKNQSLINDNAARSQVLGDVNRIRRAYDQLTNVIARMQVEYVALSKTEAADSEILKRLALQIEQATLRQAKFTEILKQAEIAHNRVSAAVNNEKQARRESYEGLGGIIKRQVEFLAGATAIASSAQFVRKGFESTYEIMNQTQRVLTVSRSNFLSLGQTAELVGNTIEKFSLKTGESTTNVGTVLKELGSAGLTTEQSVAALGSTLDNIIATESSVTETTRLVASTYNILGNSITGASDLTSNFTRINDVLARGALESSLEMDQLVQALKFSLPAAKDAGLKFEDLVGILAQLADQGIRGGNAGRALRAALQQISVDAPKFAKAFDIQIDPSKPLQFLDIVSQFGEKIRGQEIDSEQLGTVFERLGLRGADVFLLLSQGIDRVNGKIKDLRENAPGALEGIADIKLQAPERQFAILSENISKLSREILSPFVTALLFVAKAINGVAESFSRLDGLSKFLIQTLGKWILTLGAVVIAAIAVAKAMELASLSLFKVQAVAGAAGTAVTGLAGSFLGLGTSVKIFGLSLQAALGVALVLIPVIIALGTYLATKLRPSLKEVNAELVEQSKNISGQIRDQRQLIKSYKDSSAAIRDAITQRERGNLSEQDFLNTLDSIAASSAEVNEIMITNGKNYRASADSIDVLSAETEKLLEIQEKLRLENDAARALNNVQQIEEQINKINSLKNRYNDLIDKKAELEAQGFMPGSARIGVINAALERLKKEITPARNEIRQLFVEIVKIASTTTSPELLKKLNEDLVRLKALLGEETGAISTFKKLIDIIDIAGNNVREFNFKNVIYDIKLLDKASVDAARGVRGLFNSLALDTKTIFDPKIVEDFKLQLENASSFTSVAAKQFGKLLLNEQNYKGISINISDQFKKAGVGNILTSELERGLKTIADQNSGIDELLGFDEIFDISAKQAQIDEIKSLTDSFIENAIKEKQKQIEIEKSSENRARLEKEIVEIRSLGNQLSEQNASLLEDEERSLDYRVKSAQVQENIEISRNALMYAHNTALEQARDIRNNTIDQDEQQLAIAYEQLRIFNAEYDVKKLIAGLTPDQIKANKQLLEIVNDQVKLENAAAQAAAKTKRDYAAQIQAVRDASTQLLIQLKYGKSSLDQNRASLLVLEQQRKVVLDQYNKNRRGIISSLEATKELIEKGKEYLVILEKQRETLYSTREELIAQKNSLLEIAEQDLGLQGETNKLLRESVTLNDHRNYLLREITRLEAKGPNTAGDVLKLRSETAKVEGSIYKNVYEQSQLYKQSYDRQLKIFDAQKGFSESQSNIISDALERIEEPFKRLLGKRLELLPFSEVQRLGQTLKLSQSELNGFYDNASGFVELFIKATKEGRVNFEQLPPEVRKYAEAIYEANQALIEQRKIQAEISAERFKIAEALASQAAERGDFTFALEQLQKMQDLVTVLNSEGLLDKEKTQENIKKVNELFANIKDLSADQGPASFIGDTGQFQDTISTLKNLLSGVDNKIIELTGTEIKAKVEIEGLQKLADAAVGTKPLFSETNQILRGIGNTLANILQKLPKVEKSQEVQHKASGGFVSGSGTGDIVPAMLEPGEFVIPKSVVKEKGVGFFDKLISDTNGFASGGLVGSSVGFGGFSLKDPNVSMFGKELKLVENFKSVINEAFGNLKVVKADVTVEQAGQLSINANTVTMDAKVFRDFFEKLSLRSGSDLPTGPTASDTARLAKTTSERESTTQKAVESQLKRSPSNVLGVINSIISKNKTLREELIKTADSFGTSFLNAFDAYKRELQNVSTRSVNIFRRVSASAALSFISAFENIGSTIEDIFTRKLPDFLAFFLESVVLSNAKIIAEFEKQRKELRDNYNNERADLIEQLKRNQISYFDFFDKLEDLRDKNKKEEENLEKQKQEALTEELKRQLQEVARRIVELTNQISRFVSDGISGLPELVGNASSLFGNFFSGISKAAAGLGKVFGSIFGVDAKGLTGGVGALIGGAVGGIAGLFGTGPGAAATAGIGAGVGDAVGEILGGVLDTITGPLKAVGQALLTTTSTFFNLAVQGFSQLLPVVVDLLVQTPEQMNASIEAFQKLPEEMYNTVNNVVQNIPRLVSALTESSFGEKSLIVKIADAFAYAVSTAFDQIIPAFGKIISSSLIAIQPIISAIFAQIPEFFAQLSGVAASIIPAFIILFKNLVEEFVKFFIFELPDIAKNLADTFSIAIQTFLMEFQAIDFNNAFGQIANGLAQSIEEITPVIAGSLSEASGAIAQALTASAPVLATALADNAPTILDSITPAISSVIIGAVGDSSPAVNSILSKSATTFLDAIIAGLPTLLNTFGSLALNALDGIQKNLLKAANDLDAEGSIFEALIDGAVKFAEQFFSIMADFITPFAAKIAEKIPIIVATLSRIILSIQASAVSLLTRIFIQIAPVIGQIFLSTMTAIIPSMVEIFLIIFSPENVVKIAATFVEAFSSALGVNVDLSFLNIIINTLKLFLIYLPLLDKAFIVAGIAMYSLVSALAATPQVMLAMTIAASMLTLVLPILVTVMLKLNPIISGLVLIIGALLVSYQALSKTFQNLAPEINRLKEVFGDLFFEIKRSAELLGGTLVGLFSGLVSVFKSVVVNGRIARSIFGAVSRSISNVAEIFTFVLVEAIDLTIKHVGVLTDIIGRLNGHLSDASNTASESSNQFEGLANILNQVQEKLAPVVEFLMPGLEILLTALAVLLAGPFVAALLGVILVLNLVLLGMTALAEILVILTPILDLMSVIFERLSQVLQPFMPILEAVLIGFLALSGVLLLLLSPLGPLIVTIALISLSLVAIVAVIRLAAIALDALAVVANDAVDGFNNAKDAFGEFIDFIRDRVNGLLDLISTATGGSGNSSGGNPVSNFIDSLPKPPKLPKPHTGGYINAAGSLTHQFKGGGNVFAGNTLRSGDVPAILQQGEFVMRRDAVRSIGVENLAEMNKSGAVGTSGITSIAATATMGRRRSDPFLNEMEDVLDGFIIDLKQALEISSIASSRDIRGINTMTSGTNPRDTMGNSTITSANLSRENANTIDYYLENFYGRDAGNDNVSVTSAPGTNAAGQEYNFAPVVTLSSEDVELLTSTKEEKKTSPVIINIDLKGSNIMGENSAELIEKQIVEKLSNDDGRLARFLREGK